MLSKSPVEILEIYKDKKEKRREILGTSVQSAKCKLKVTYTLRYEK